MVSFGAASPHFTCTSKQWVEGDGRTKVPAFAHRNAAPKPREGAQAEAAAQVHEVEHAERPGEAGVVEDAQRGPHAREGSQAQRAAEVEHVEDAQCGAAAGARAHRAVATLSRNPF